MKRPLFCLLVFWAVLVPRPAAARIATLGEISKVGLWDENPLHVAILMDAEGRKALTSQNGGITWIKSEAELSPEKLRPLPQEGQVQYRFARFPERDGVIMLSGQTLIQSTDGGQTWLDVSPWGFLRDQFRDEVENRKAEYLASYGHWLPSYDDNWLMVFSVSGGFLLLVVGWMLWRQKQAFCSSLLLSGVCSLGGAIAFSAIRVSGNYMFVTAQWEGIMVSNSGWIIAPRWPWGLAMHLTSDVSLAPLAAIFSLSISPLNFALMAALPRWRKALQICGLAVAIMIVLLAAGVIFYGRERAL